MKIILGFFSFLWRIWFAFTLFTVTFIFSIFIILPLLLLLKEKKFNILYWFLRLWAKIVFYGSGLYYKLHSDIHLNKNKSYIIVANHTSLMDIMLMFIIIKQPMVFVGKAELSKIPVFGLIFKRINVPVDRKNSTSRASVYPNVTKKINEGKSVCIFPEGGVPDYDVFLDTFKKGAFKLSVTLDIPMAVFTFCGVKKRVPYAYFKGGPGRIDVFFNEIIPAGKYSENEISEFSNTVRNSIYHTLKSCQKK